jgi:hypothetical protein
MVEQLTLEQAEQLYEELMQQYRLAQVTSVPVKTVPDATPKKHASTFQSATRLLRRMSVGATK